MSYDQSGSPPPRERQRKEGGGPWRFFVILGVAFLMIMLTYWIMSTSGNTIGKLSGKSTTTKETKGFSFSRLFGGSDPQTDDPNKYDKQDVQAIDEPVEGAVAP